MKKLIILLLTPLYLLSQDDYTQNIDLPTGWSAFSTYIIPENNNIEEIFSTIANDITIIKDGEGNVYWPEFNINSIENITIGSGYQIRMINDQNITISGDLANCGTELDLSPGWHLIGYLNQNEYDIEEIMASIINELIIIKDDNGNVYWPEYGLNNIINMSPGKGYYIKVSDDVNLSFCNNICENYSYSCDGGTWQEEVSWEIQNQNGEILYSGGAPDSGELCLNDGCYIVTVTDSWGDGWNGNTLNIGDLLFVNEDLDGCNSNNCPEETQIFEFCVPIVIVEGCTDSEASNYDETANLDDNSCIYPNSSLNMDLLGVIDYDETINDIWGYSNGNNEYALVGTNEGFSVVDITIPENPTELFFIEGTETIWRDIKTWNNYAYVVCDNCPDGLLIVDLNDLSGNTYNFNTDFFDKAHNLFIDENGYLYAFGGDPYGAMILNLNNDPMNPVLEGGFLDYYLHDGMVRGDTLWGGAISQGIFTVVNVTDKSNPSLMSSYPTSANFTHNCWISEDGNTLFTTDEVSGAYIGAYDVSNIYDIEQSNLIQEWTGLGNVVPHNTHVIGNYLVTSYYTSGVTIVDASDPYNLTEVAYFDTSPQYEGNGFNGCWGAYPYLPSGLILATDRENGLHILSTPYSEFFND